MSLELTGQLIEKYDTIQVSDKFKKREFVLSVKEDINGRAYENFAKFQTVQNKCDLLDRFNIGDTVQVMFNIKGNGWERDGKVNYITSLDAWKIEKLIAQREGAPATDYTFKPKTTEVPTTPEDDGSLPF